MKRSEADILADQVLSFGEVSRPTGDIPISGEAYSFDSPADKPYLNQIRMLPYIGVNLYRGWLGGVRPKYPNDWIYNPQNIEPGCETRYEGRRIIRQKGSSYVSPAGIFDEKGGENKSWKVLNFPCSLGEWVKEEIRFPDAPQLSPSTLQINAGTIVGMGEEVRIPNLSDLLKIRNGNSDGRQAQNTPMGYTSYKNGGKTLAAYVPYPNKFDGNIVVSGLYARPSYYDSSGWQFYIDNPSITARVYLCPNDEVSPEYLATSHQFRWQAAFVSMFPHNLIDVGLYSLHSISSWLQYMTIYENKIKGKQIYSSSTGNEGLTDEQIASNQSVSEARNEISTTWLKDALFLWNSDIGFFYDDFQAFPIGREIIDSRQITLERGVSYNVIVELDNFVGQPEFTTLSILRCEHKRRPMQIRI